MSLFLFRFTFIMLVLVLPLKCHEWSPAPILAWLRQEPQRYRRSECCFGVKSMAAPSVNLFLASTN